jgi:capsid portal protein
VRWIGQVLGIDGSRKAEELNNKYFDSGRHMPLLILSRGGNITDESYAKMQEYMSGLRGAESWHGWLVLEAQNTDNYTAGDTPKNPDVEIHKLADILQNDELFQTYLDNNRRRVQSAFRLPDLYVGYTTDFNRATAQVAQEVTEAQVFQPERQSLAWVINHKLLAEYKFKHVEAYFKAPDISNPEDMTKILNITERAGGLTPNKAKEITYDLLGEKSVNFDGEWGETPLAYAKLGQSGSAVPVQKSANYAHDEIVAVMKEVRGMLMKGGGV